MYLSEEDPSDHELDLVLDPGEQDVAEMLGDLVSALTAINIVTVDDLASDPRAYLQELALRYADREATA